MHRAATYLAAASVGGMVGVVGALHRWPFWLGLVVAVAATALFAFRPNLLRLPSIAMLMAERDADELIASMPAGTPPDVATEALRALIAYHFGPRR